MGLSFKELHLKFIFIFPDAEASLCHPGALGTCGLAYLIPPGVLWYFSTYLPGVTGKVHCLVQPRLLGVTLHRVRRFNVTTFHNIVNCQKCFLGIESRDSFGETLLGGKMFFRDRVEIVKGIDIFEEICRAVF